MMEISYKKDGNRNFMIIKELEVDEEDYKLQMVVNNRIEGILPLSIRTINNKPEIYYGITSMISMESMYAKKQMSGKDVYELVKSIKELAEKMNEYLLDINNIIFETEFIYLKRQEKKYTFCYCPGAGENYQEKLRSFFDKLLEYINHDDRKAVLIAYGIQQITLGNNFTVQDLMDCAEKNIHEKKEENINKPLIRDISDSKICEKNEIPDLDKTESRKGFFRNVIEILKGKRKYKDEKELEYSGLNDIDDGNIRIYEEGEKTEIIAAEMEEETMLLTTGETTPAIALKSIDLENPLEIIPDRMPCIVGKSKKTSDFCLENPVISRVHMRISEEREGYFVEDLNSTNGTFVNGIQLAPHQLKEINVGDRITLANMDFVVEQS